MTGTTGPTIWIGDGLGGRAPHRLGVGSLIVGRHHEAGICLADDDVSSHHAELYWDGERLRVRDLGSRLGTEVNGAPVVDWIDLTEGDVIRFGAVDGTVEMAADGPALWTSAPQATVPVQGSAPKASRTPVFISHSAEDKRYVRLIAEYLRRQRWNVWVDEAGISGGKDYRAELMQALESSWIVVLVVSHASMTSKWVLREVEAADRLGLQVVPVVVEDVPYPDSLRMSLSSVQKVLATSLGDSDRRNAQLSRIDDALTTAASTRRHGKPGRFRMAVGMIIGILGGLGIVLGFASFVYLSETSGGGSEPVLGWGVFMASMLITAIGSAIYASGKKKGI